MTGFFPHTPPDRVLEIPYDEVELKVWRYLHIHCAHCATKSTAPERHICIGAILDWIWACTEKERKSEPGAENIFQDCYEEQIDWRPS